MQTLSTARRTVSRRLAGLDLPACFQIATVNAAINATERSTKSAKASRRRLVAKCERLASVEVGR